MNYETQVLRLYARIEYDWIPGGVYPALDAGREWLRGRGQVSIVVVGENTNNGNSKDEWIPGQARDDKRTIYPRFKSCGN